MARHLTAPFLEAVLNRGKYVAQLLSYSVREGERVIRWVSLCRRDQLVEVSLHEVLDAAEEGVVDVTEFPSLDPDEEHGAGKLRSFASLEEALGWIEGSLGGSRARFVNLGVIQDEVDEARSAAAAP